MHLNRRRLSRSGNRDRANAGHGRRGLCGHRSLDEQPDEKPDNRAEQGARDESILHGGDPITGHGVHHGGGSAGAFQVANGALSPR